MGSCLGDLVIKISLYYERQQTYAHFSRALLSVLPKNLDGKLISGFSDPVCGRLEWIEWWPTNWEETKLEPHPYISRFQWAWIRYATTNVAPLRKMIKATFIYICVQRHLMKALALLYPIHNRVLFHILNLYLPPIRLASSQKICWRIKKKDLHI